MRRSRAPQREICFDVRAESFVCHALRDRVSELAVQPGGDGVRAAPQLVAKRNAATQMNWTRPATRAALLLPQPVEHARHLPAQVPARHPDITSCPRHEGSDPVDGHVMAACLSDEESRISELVRSTTYLLLGPPEQTPCPEMHCVVPPA